MRSEVVREIVEPFTTPERQRDLAGGLSRRPVVAPQLLSRLPDDLKEHRSIMWLTAIWYQNRRHARIAIGQLAYLPVIVDPEISAITATRHLSRAHHATDLAKRLGIRPQRIAPGKPQQNGRHERMHQTLKQAVARPPRASWPAQQRALEAFRHEYNYERPHEALHLTPPADHYVPAPHSDPRPLGVHYPAHYVVRRVRTNGEIKWRGQRHFLSEVLCGELVGLTQATDRYWHIYFGPVPLATMDDYYPATASCPAHSRANR